MQAIKKLTLSKANETNKGLVWFTIKHDGIQAYVLGKEIPFSQGTDFPLDFKMDKPVIFIEHGYPPVVCKLMAIDEISQQVKIELLLEKKKPNICIAAETIYRAYELLWYCGTGSVTKAEQLRIKAVLHDNDIRFLCA